MKKNKFIVYFKESEVLAKALAKKAGIKAFELEVKTYSFGEFTVNISEFPLSGDVYFILQDDGRPSELIMKTMMAIDALENYKPLRINILIPYLPFSRQDKRTNNNRALASRVIGDIFNSGFISNIYTFDLHNDVITKHFKAPVYNLTMLDAFIKYFKAKNLEDVVIVAPDYGRFKAAKYVSEAFNNAEFVLINKQRLNNTVVINSIEGETKGKTALIIEDIIDTGTTLLSAVAALKEAGVKAIYVAATHGVFSSNALQKIMSVGIEEVIITNTINTDSSYTNLVILPIEDYLLPIIED